MSVISDHYAVALFELAIEEDSIVKIQSALKDFKGFLDEETKAFFAHPTIHKEAKKALVEQLELESLLKHFLAVLIDNQRMLVFDEIVKSYNKLVEAQADILRIKVFSKHPLKEEKKNILKQQYEKKYNRNVIIENILDETMVGGLRFEFDGLVVDDSVNYNLNQLKSRLMK